jgi:hypothetical protein
MSYKHRGGYEEVMHILVLLHVPSLNPCDRQTDIQTTSFAKQDTAG